MKDKLKVTGQSVDYKEHNDNAPPRYSAPSYAFKEVLKYHCDSNCPSCGGNGYIGRFKHIAGGRCFDCLPDHHWEALLGELKATGTDDCTGEEVCEIRYVTTDAYTDSGYAVMEIGLPPVGEFETFETFEEARAFAKEKYGV